MAHFPLKRGGVSRYPTTKTAAIAGRARRYDVDTGDACTECTDYQAHTSEGFQRFTVNDRCALCSSMDSFDMYGILVHKIGFDGKTVEVTSRSYPDNLPRDLSDETIELYRIAGDALYTDAQRIGPLESWPVPAFNAGQASEAGVKCYIHPEPCVKCGAPGVRTLAGDCHYCELRKGELSPRQEAIKAGKTWYTPKKPCKKCNTMSERNVFNGTCRGCTGQSDNRETAESVMMRAAPDLVISRADAMALGLKVFRTGEKCRRGHTGFRYVSTGGCIGCKKKGSRPEPPGMSTDIAKIAQAHITRLSALVEQPESKERRAFEGFLEELRNNLNDSVTFDEAIEMLAQHLITKPVFETLFQDTQQNPVSQAMQTVLDVLEEKESTALDKFYASGIETADGKQRLIVELYDKFFRKAFPRMTERLGIVYTPVEVVDFIIHSVADVLQSQFGQTFGSPGVHIIDPFVGTGTFITRLLQSGLIKPEELAYKYTHEIHANEIVLLAYYIAAINIEAVYHALSGQYAPFGGIHLTDTFLLDNRQKELDIRVIMGNPPYSVGQGSANDNNANLDYPNLDEGIRETYAKHSSATNKNALYDSYIRAIRWGSNHLGESGIMAFVTNAGWIEGNAMDGLRKCLIEEFSTLYIFHLRGNQRTSGELSKKEGGKIFGSGSRAPIAITLFVKNPNAVAEYGHIYYHDIGDYLSQKDKLSIISDFVSIDGIDRKEGWQIITPDKSHDWLNQRDDSFDQFIVMGNKKDKTATTIFEKYSIGIKTNRDAWCYNASKQIVANNMKKMINFYNNEIDRGDFINNDSTKISWSGDLVQKFEKQIKGQFRSSALTSSVYRPFQKQWLYYDGLFNNRVYQMPRIFPNDQTQNMVIAVTGIGSGAGFSALMVDTLPCLEFCQCFPLKLYDGYAVHDGITDAGLAHFQAAYSGTPITKEDIFYYIYGLLHSEEYRKRYANNLSKQLPRIPCVKNPWPFIEAGRKLADLHVNYESVEPYPVEFKGAEYRVGKKWKFGGDKTTVIYNPKITLTNVPLEAYDYVVNGKPALEWVMERQVIKTDKASGIVNDANRYAIETVGDAAYPLKLFQRVITVSLETLKIVNGLPGLEIKKAPEDRG